jgi:hypothetical protein
MISCIYCRRIFSNAGGYSCHSPYCILNPERTQRDKSPYAHRAKGVAPWNKGLKNDPRSKRSEKCIAKLKEKANGRASTPEAEEIRKQKIKVKAKLNNGGHRLGSGRGKKGWYKGFFCDSSWELAYVIYCLDHGIDIKRNTDKRKYEYNNIERNYIPDFIVNGILTEIKGYKTDQWMAKLKFNPDVNVLYEKDLQLMFKYVVTTYGKDFIKLYGR